MVEQDDLRAPHFGADINTAPPPLSLQLPKDQQEKVIANGGLDISGVRLDGAVNGVKPDVSETKAESSKVEISTT